MIKVNYFYVQYVAVIVASRSNIQPVRHSAGEFGYCGQVEWWEFDFFAEFLCCVPLEGNSDLADSVTHDDQVTDSQLVPAAEDVDPPASIIQHGSYRLMVSLIIVINN